MAENYKHLYHQMKKMVQMYQDEIVPMMREQIENVKWVSVEKELPEKGKDVLMYFDSGNMAVGFWHDSDEHITFWCAYTDDGFYTDCDCIPTHWMHLPEEPER